MQVAPISCVLCDKRSRQRNHDQDQNRNRNASVSIESPHERGRDGRRHPANRGDDDVRDWQRYSFGLVAVFLVFGFLVHEATLSQWLRTGA